MNAKKSAVISQNLNPAGPQPLADEELGTVVGGHGHKGKKRSTTFYRTTRRSRPSTRRSRHSRHSRYSWF
jgi:hypothetical protein